MIAIKDMCDNKPDGYRCFFCFKCMYASEQRMQCLETLRTFIRDDCQPTCFVYPWLLNIETEPYLCMACVNWQRRCSIRGKKHLRKVSRQRQGATFEFTPKPFLQMDQIILFLLNPGKFYLPDQRCLPKLLNSLCEEGNPMQHIAPPNVIGIAKTVEKHTLLGMVKAWWHWNKNTHFMLYSSTARMIRGMVNGRHDVMDAVEVESLDEGAEELDDLLEKDADFCMEI